MISTLMMEDQVRIYLLQWGCHQSCRSSCNIILQLLKQTKLIWVEDGSYHLKTTRESLFMLSPLTIEINPLVSNIEF